MHSYNYFNLVLESDIEFPALPCHPDDPVGPRGKRVSISLAGKAPQDPERGEWFWMGDDDVAAFARTGGGYLLRYPGVADFEVQQRNRSVVVANPQAGIDTVRHYLLHQIIPRLLGQDGQLALHASAVEIEGEDGLVFAGPSGAGKSTLARSFECSVGRRAFADDCVLTSGDNERTWAVPAVPRRSAPSAPSGRAGSEAGIPIAAVFLLSGAAQPARPNTCQIERLGAADATIAILGRRFSIDHEDMEVESRIFRNVGRILSSGVRVFNLHYPHDHSLLPVVRRSIGAELGLAID